MPREAAGKLRGSCAGSLRREAASGKQRQGGGGLLLGIVRVSCRRVQRPLGHKAGALPAGRPNHSVPRRCRAALTRVCDK
jgi:hypothetical protein